MLLFKHVLNGKSVICMTFDKCGPHTVIQNALFKMHKKRVSPMTVRPLRIPIPPKKYIFHIELRQYVKRVTIKR